MMQAAKGKGYILAGGTDLLVQMKSGARTPGVIVDVKKIPEMVSITEKKGAFTIGAATPAAVLGEHKKLRKAWPGVIEACNLIGSTQVQGRASAGGNLCNASPAADSVPALVAAGCIVNVAGPNGKRDVPVEKFCTGPGKTSLKTGEIVVSLDPAGAAEGLVGRLPAPDPAHRDGHRRRRRRRLAHHEGRHRHRRARRPRRRGAHRAAGRQGGQGADRLQARRRGARRRRRRLLAPPAVRSTTSAAPSSIAPRSPACCSSARP